MILVDNGSTDGTLEVLKEWQREQKSHGWDVEVLEELQPGACLARNRGLEQAGDGWVMFFDSDDLMAPNHVADFMSAAEKHPKAGIIGRDITIGLNDGSSRRGYFKEKNPVFNHIFRGSLSTQRFIARKALFQKAGSWNPEAKVWNDWEMGLRILLHHPAVKIVKIPGEPTVTTTFQAQSITGARFSDKAGQWENTVALCRMEAEKMGRIDVVRWLDCREAILAAQYAREGYSEQAARIMSRLAEQSPVGSRKLRMLYNHNLRFGRLTWGLVRALFI